MFFKLKCLLINIKRQYSPRIASKWQHFTNSEISTGDTILLINREGLVLIKSTTFRRKVASEKQVHFAINIYSPKVLYITKIKDPVIFKSGRGIITFKFSKNLFFVFYVLKNTYNAESNKLKRMRIMKLELGQFEIDKCLLTQIFYWFLNFESVYWKLLFC